ncbi:unnamed protein product [Prunus armeniaca]|uniref:Uncharacterized protein n=1 Tax=Prunus armeniaca TaxID=36596 RepID=A0A6J5W2Z1_PRUAR|nr:unnamed protein product [Prunus armeniaca]
MQISFGVVLAWLPSTFAFVVIDFSFPRLTPLEVTDFRNHTRPWIFYRKRSCSHKDYHDPLLGSNADVEEDSIWVPFLVVHPNLSIAARVPLIECRGCTILNGAHSPS